MTERMAVEITVYLDVPDDITEDGMDRAAESVRVAVEAGVECVGVALLNTPALVDYVGGVA